MPGASGCRRAALAAPLAGLTLLCWPVAAAQRPPAHAELPPWLASPEKANAGSLASLRKREGLTKRRLVGAANNAVPTAAPTMNNNMTVLAVIYHNVLERTGEKAKAGGDHTVTTKVQVPEIASYSVTAGKGHPVPSRAKTGQPSAFRAFLKKRIANLEAIVKMKKSSVEHGAEHGPVNTQIEEWNKRQPEHIIHFAGDMRKIGGLVLLYKHMQQLETQLRKLRGATTR